MNIEFLSPAKGGIIAMENASNGEFIVNSDGTIWYRNELATREMFVSRTEAAFRPAVGAFHRYNENVIGANEELAKLAVTQLASELRKLDCLNDGEDSFWPIILEQAKHGML